MNEQLGNALFGSSLTATRDSDLARNRVVAFVLWRVPLILVALGVIVPDFVGWLWPPGFLWIGAGCTANAIRCGRTHCAIMGPLFLGLGLVSLARALGMIGLDWNTLGVAALTSVALSYLPEFMGRKYLRPDTVCEGSDSEGC